ncbi:putative reverse transcriptase domain-containing protein, partial [Tanacetum coccineum]
MVDLYRKKYNLEAAISNPDDWLSSSFGYDTTSLKIVMENPNHLNEPNESIPEVNPVVPEPNQVADIHDPNEMVDIPDDIDLVDYDDEDPEEDPEEDLKEEPEEEPKEDVDIELEDDAELIFPYKVEGDKTPPPGDVSSDSESEDEEIDVAPEVDVALEVDVAFEAIVGTSTQNPYAIHDFPRGLYEVGESSSARDSSYVGGLAPRALRRDLETSRARARLTEAELSTNQTKIALLKSKNKIGEKERELLNHDLENVERALGNVLERVSVLESGEKATLKKRLAETETKLVWARMERETTERRIMPPKSMSKACMREVIKEQVNSSKAEFMVNMNRGAGGNEACSGGAGGAGAGGAGAGGARPTAPKIISDCKERDKVKFTTATLQGRALTWWNGRIASMGIDAANGESGAVYCGLSKNIRGINEVVRMAYQLMGQIIQDKTDEVSKGEKRKGEGDRGGRSDNRRDYNHRQNQRRANTGAMTNATPNDNEVCPTCKNKKHGGDCGKCGKLGHKTAACWRLDRKDVTYFNCNEQSHRKRDCPKLKNNEQGRNNRGAVYKLGVVDAQQDPKVVT